MKCLWFCLLLPLSLLGLSDQELKNRMHNDLNTIKGIFEVQYAPIEWKQSYSGFDIDYEIDQAKTKINQIPYITIKDYQRIVKNFFKSVSDHHVNVSFYSTESATLPLRIKGSEGRYFISTVNRKKLPEGCLLQVGDEIMTFNGRPLVDVLEEFQEEEFGHGTLTHKALAEMSFNRREGSSGHVVPQGEVILGVLPKNENEEVTYTLSWNYSDEEINEIPLKQPLAVHSLMRADGIFKEKQKKLKLFKKSMLSPYFEISKREEGFTAGDGLGDRTSFIPALGKKIWASHPGSHFHAYLFETPDQHRYGYIRIPTYNGSVVEFKQFKELIERFEAESEALIIDQVNNPGGSLFYMYALASTLTDRPLFIPPHRITITQKEIASALEMLPTLDQIETDEDAIDAIGEEFDGLPVNVATAQQMADYFRFLVSQWNLGITFTSPYHLWGYDLLLPDPEVQYTKPILLLINQLDFSCADFFPSILQDNQRATLFGKTTGGAGGFVLKAEYPNMFGVNFFSYTGSIAYRSNNNPIENLGVTPDIEYEISVQDLTQFYAPFKEKILESVKSLSN